MDSFVYCWTDTKTNKIYVGSHKGSDTDGYVSSSKYMMNEYRKRPYDFTRQIIAHGLHRDMLKLESKILQSANAAKSDEFYNKHNNNGTYSAYGPKSDKTKEKMRNAKLGTHRSIETNLKHSKSISGELNHFYGKTHSDEVKALLSKIKKLNYIGEGHPSSIPLIYNGVRYVNKKEMTEKTGISLYMINRMIKTKEVVTAK
jgi:hypothetical protein